MKKVVKVPVVMQLEALECGAACLAMILAYHNKWVPLEQVRSDCGVSRDGSNVGGITRAARGYGLDAATYKAEVEALVNEGEFPCIIHWKFNHFVVLNGFKGNKAYINDPARGTYSVSMDEFDESFTGICMLFSPSEDFEPSGSPKKMSDYAITRLKGTGAAVAFAVITAIIISLMDVITPVFSRIFIDRLLTQKNPEWVIPFLIVLALFSLIQVVVSVIQAIYTLRINGKMAMVGSSTFMWKLLRLPVNFFSQRMAGDLQARQYSNEGIANTLIQTVAPLALNCMMLIFYLIVMVRYSVILAIVGISSLIINYAVSTLMARKQVNISRVTMRDSANLSSMTVSGIEMIETIKSSGAENGFFYKWAGYQANLNNQEEKMHKLQAYFGSVTEVISMIANDAVLILGVFLTMKGDFTVGMIMAFQGFLSSFMQPAMSLISARNTILVMRTEMERVEDVMQYPDDDIFSDVKLKPEKEYSRLRGEIEIKDLTFGYSKYGKPVIKNFNMKLQPGKSVAIVGGSGCGKSTMTGLISGLYEPWEGKILYDGKQIREIPKSLFKSSMSVVDQEIILFEDTIENNIKMWDETIEDFEMIMAARDAQIHSDIMERSGGYQYKLSEGGKNLSGGQRQRLEIARVLAQEPTIIILDEATSALDAKTEYSVIKSIKDRGISCIVIAHRLSTIRSCDEIIVMEKGEIAARGTHKELMQSSSMYQELVTSE